jgi:hypothetical protein
MGDEGGKSAVAAPASLNTQAFFQDLLRRYFEHYLPATAAPRLLDGRDLIRHFGLAPSPTIGRLLAELQEETLAGHLDSRKAALAFVQRRLDEDR